MSHGEDSDLYHCNDCILHFSKWRTQHQPVGVAKENAVVSVEDSVVVDAAVVEAVVVEEAVVAGIREIRNGYQLPSLVVLSKTVESKLWRRSTFSLSLSRYPQSEHAHRLFYIWRHI